MNWEKYKFKHSRLRTDFFLFTSDLPKGFKKKKLKKKQTIKKNQLKRGLPEEEPVLYGAEQEFMHVFKQQLSALQESHTRVAVREL